jgi:hypothetical protein
MGRLPLRAFTVAVGIGTFLVYTAAGIGGFLVLAWLFANSPSTGHQRSTAGWTDSVAG